METRALLVLLGSTTDLCLCVFMDSTVYFCFFGLTCGDRTNKCRFGDAFIMLEGVWTFQIVQIDMTFLNKSCKTVML